MDPILQKAIIYWKIIKAFDIWDDLEQKGLAPDGMREKILMELITRYSLDESYEKLCGKAYRKELTATFGQNMENSPLPVCRAMVSAKAKAKVKPAYRNFAEILVLNQSELSSSYALQHWLRSRNTLEFLSIWEQRNNMTFKKEQADLFIRAARKTNTTITLKK